MLIIQRSSRRPLRKHILIIHAEKFKEKSKTNYAEDSGKFKQAFRNDYIKHMNERKEKSKVNYFEHREERYDARRDRYVLTAPHDRLIKISLDQLISKILSNPEIKHSLTMSFNVLFKDDVRTLDNKTKARTACELASRKLLHQVLLLWKFNAGMLLKHIRQVNSLQINGKEDFGKTGHSLSSEPYFYESSYKYCF